MVFTFTEVLNMLSILLFAVTIIASIACKVLGFAFVIAGTLAGIEFLGIHDFNVDVDFIALTIDIGILWLVGAVVAIITYILATRLVAK